MPTPFLIRRLLLTTDAVGGVWTYTLDLARACSQLDIAVDLVVIGPEPSPEKTTEAASIRNVRLTHLDLPLDWMAEDVEAVRKVGERLSALATKSGCDLAHLHSPALAADASFPVPLVASLHSCVGTWWREVRRGEDMPEDFAWRTALMRRALRRADAVIVPSASFADTAGKVYGGNIPFRVVHNGTSFPGAGPEMDRSVVLSAGRFWDESKNLAALDLAASHLGFSVYVAGPLEGPNGACVCPRHVRRLGELSRSAMQAWLARTSIFVSTALYEPFGLSVLEAAQSGCALVLSDIPTFHELWDGAALFVDPRRSRSVADSVTELAADEELTERLAASARRRARQYSMEAVVGRTLAIYREVAARSVPTLRGAA
ncbi:glycosyltransferase family 4 protein [Afifella sp. JA880]|uniref:glycosyltransferase family 4 protein n=1 Tax=Afifella sp. JA880 TaxID=2975280 RepID=UPI0021BB7DFA|nr:glycosyltransferase family 4 protein [Afifella sp. JA880]MCT8266283.1 glycosyltransferase family 4 protein [Afifella sp. JA880]